MENHESAAPEMSVDPILPGNGGKQKSKPKAKKIGLDPAIEAAPKPARSKTARAPKVDKDTEPAKLEKDGRTPVPTSPALSEDLMRHLENEHRIEKLRREHEELTDKVFPMYASTESTKQTAVARQLENSIEAGPVRKIDISKEIPAPPSLHDKLFPEKAAAMALARDVALRESLVKHYEDFVLRVPHPVLDEKETDDLVKEHIATLKQIKNVEERDYAAGAMRHMQYMKHYGEALRRQDFEIAKEVQEAGETFSKMEDAKDMAQERGATVRDIARAKEIDLGQAGPQRQVQDLGREVAEVGKKLGPELNTEATHDQGTAAKTVAAPVQGHNEPAVGKIPAWLNAEEDRSTAVPESVKARFIQVDNKYYFPDKTPAFVDNGKKLATQGENAEVIRSLVAIAKARGWKSVTVKGTEEFRRAAWQEASMAGLEVAGYKATKVEEAALAKQMAARKQARENSIEHGIDRARSPEPDQASAAVQKPPETARRSAAYVPPDPPPNGVVGKLLEHGAAKYQNNPKKEDSYFVKVETRNGEKTIWGVDLERAINSAGVRVGETISVDKKGRKAVTAQERVFDKAGVEVGIRPVDAMRNEWFIGALDKAAAFSQGERAEVVAKHPDLAPAYGTVAAARKFAEKAFPDDKKNQDLFADVAQQVIASKIARGEPVPAPKIRETRMLANEKGHGKGRDAAPQAPTRKDSEQELAR